MFLQLWWLEVFSKPSSRWNIAIVFTENVYCSQNKKCKYRQWNNLFDSSVVIVEINKSKPLSVNQAKHTFNLEGIQW